MTIDHEQLVLDAAAAILRARGENKKADTLLGKGGARGRAIVAPADSATVLQKRTYERLVDVNESQRSISKRAGLGPDFIRCIMDGRSKDPGAAKLFKLAAALKCSPQYLLGLSDEP